MRTQGLVILAACLAVAMAVPAQDRAVQAVTSGINQFSSAFYSEVSASNSGNNLITSPLSASVVLSMAAYGARGETEKEFKQVLHLPEESVARTGYANLIDSLNAVENVELKLANKAFVNEHYTIKESYQELTRTAFRSASQNVNFGNSQEAANTINQWVEAQTNNRIKDLITPDKVNSDTAMVLVNAIYFKGNWANKFDTKLTQDRPFHVTKDQVKDVPTMHKVGNFRYGVLPELNARFVILPYKGDELSMVIFLPDAINGLRELEEKLKFQNLNNLVSNSYKTEVSLYLPKFKIESTLDLGTHLQNLGLKKAFDKLSADFSGISDTSVYISSVVQKAFIEVNEEGSEAAGATEVGIVTLSMVYPEEFKVDRPFYYTIGKKIPADRNREESIVSLFTGHVEEFDN